MVLDHFAGEGRGGVCNASDGNFSLCQLDTCKCVVLFFMYICKCSLMPFLYVLFVKILSYVEEIKNIYLSIYLSIYLVYFISVYIIELYFGLF